MSKFNKRLHQLAFMIELGLISIYAATNKLFVSSSEGTWSACRSKLYRARKKLTTMTKDDWTVYYQRRDDSRYVVMDSNGKIKGIN